MTAYRSLLTHVAAHTINDPSNCGLNTVPDSVEWSRVGEHEELTVDGQPMKICYHGVVKSVVFIPHHCNDDLARMLISFDIAGDEEKQGLHKIKYFNGFDEGMAPNCLECAWLTPNSDLGTCSLMCFADIGSEASVRNLC